MSLRIEGHAILWVTALLSLGVTVFHGNVLELQETPDQLDSRSSIPARPDPVQTTGDRLVMRVSLPDIDRSARTLFYIVSAQQTPPAAPPATASEGAQPILKGIVSSGGQFQAVFATSQSGSGYVTAGVGDAVAGFRVTNVGPDRVVVAAPGGDKAIIALRGAGELP